MSRTQSTAAPVYIVHCVDTEGPLYESLEAKFQRLDHLFGITHLEKTEATLEKLRRGEIDIGGREAHVATVLGSHLTNYMETWTQVDAMLDRVMAPAFRDALRDSDGHGWCFNWFCLDHVGFVNNPRRRDMGFHNIFDHYRDRLARSREPRDGLHWHFHPVSTYRDAHHCATHYFRSPEIFEILARKVIERRWFPSAFRAGFQAERPDSHWFLEQWIPFDITNMALDDNGELDRTVDFRNGRSGDWRRAPADWSVYHPSHDDYQMPGLCRRSIARCLNVLNRIASIDQREMDKAFARAAQGLPALVGICSHDFRDLGPEVDHVRALLKESHMRYPDVPFHFAEAADAFRNVLWPDGVDQPALDLDVRFHPAASGDVPFIEIKAKQGSVFGPQPFLAIETRGRKFLHDNLDFAADGSRWFYAFHGDTLELDDVVRIGVAANDKAGRTSVRVLDVAAGQTGWPAR
jgi:hypothetical protein